MLKYVSYTDDNLHFSLLYCLYFCLYVFEFLISLYLICLLLSSLLPPSPVSVFCVSLSLHLCALLSSDISRCVFLLSHKVPSYGNAFIRDTQMCKYAITLLLFTCHPVWMETNTSSCQASAASVLPLNTVVFSNIKTENNEEEKKERQNDGHLIPDILRTEINKHT